jgi:hypothetical protein
MPQKLKRSPTVLTPCFMASLFKRILRASNVATTVSDAVYTEGGDSILSLVNCTSDITEDLMEETSMSPPPAFLGGTVPLPVKAGVTAPALGTTLLEPVEIFTLPLTLLGSTNDGDHPASVALSLPSSSSNSSFCSSSPLPTGPDLNRWRIYQLYLPPYSQYPESNLKICHAFAIN